MTEPNAPDIEIYVADLDTQQALNWLNTVFSEATVKPKQKGMPRNATPLNLIWQDRSIFAVIYEKVVPGFTSIWMDSKELPWPDDEQCAKAAAKATGKNVRVTAGGWQQNDDPDAWFEIDPDGQVQKISWKS